MIANVTEQLWIDFGLDTAVFLDTMAYWLKKNAGNKQPRNFHDGRYWTYNTLDAFHLMFPGWSRDTIRGIIRKCVKNGLLLVGNFNKNKYDRTCWYTLTDKGLEYYPALCSIMKEKADNPGGDSCGDFAAPSGEIPTPIPKLLPTSTNINISTKENSKNLNKNSFGIKEMLDDNPHEIPEEHIRQWKLNRGKHQVTRLAWNRINKNLTQLVADGISPLDAFDRMVAAGWRSLELEYFQKSAATQISNKPVSQWSVDAVWKA